MPQRTTRKTVTGKDSPLLCSRTFPATSDQASQARRFLAGALDGSPLTDDATTCLGELVNNSLIHSDSRLPGGAFTVRVEKHPGRLRVEVHDEGGPWAPGRTGRPGRLDDGGHPDTCGRGLLIVAALAARWGVAPRTAAPRRIAFFELDLP